MSETPEQEFNRLERGRDMSRWWATYKQVLEEAGFKDFRLIKVYQIPPEAKPYLDQIDSELEIYPYGEDRLLPSVEIARSIAQASLKEIVRKRTQMTEEFECITPEMLVEYERRFKRGLL